MKPFLTLPFRSELYEVVFQKSPLIKKAELEKLRF